MEKREDALREALTKNAEETERWEHYKKDNAEAIENVEMFSKHLTVDVMVPLGRKAYLPGQLIHTNEVLVSHYQGYFSKCSAHKAKEICEHRLRTAREQLKKLQTEAELWQNKLDKPYVEGVLPNAEECEIIEDYDEEKERRWREEHKLRVKQAKLIEKAERERERENETAVKGKASVAVECAAKELSDEEVLRRLEEAELLEELKQELDKLEVDEVNDETIRKLIAGEIKLPAEKPRVAHKETDVLKLAAEGHMELQGIVKKSEQQLNSTKIPPTNNNVRPNPELLQTAAVSVESADDDSELPIEVQIIQKEAETLLPEFCVQYYDCQIQIIRQKMLALPLKNEAGMEEKIRLMMVLEQLEELLETALERCEVEDEEMQITNDEPELAEEEESEVGLELVRNEDNESNIVPKSGKQQKRHISFALENETLEFRRHETVSEMLLKTDKSKEGAKRDIITLDKPLACKKKAESAAAAVVDKKQFIRNKVEQNLKYMTEHQSKQDCDLVNQILESTMGMVHTLDISFKHSAQPGTEMHNTCEAADDADIPGSPADIYRLYLKMLESQKPKEPTTIFVNAYEGEDEVKVPVLKEANRQHAYEDPRMKFSKPLVGQREGTANTKPILRNRAVPEKEKHKLGGKNKQKKTKPPVNEEEYMSAYFKVMNDVVEKPLTAPEPLPEGKFIDAHTPKKRVSRFKQLRATGAENV